MLLLKITDSPSCDAKITITFEDGLFEVYSENFVPPLYAGGAIMEKRAFNITDNHLSINVTIQNTGNIPMTKFKVTIDDYETLIPLSHVVMPKDKIELTNESLSGNFELNVQYTAYYEYIFVDDSTFGSHSSFEIRKVT